ncbi:S8 family peptidase [Streptomyces pacificus]|uniref:S8 family serine peptidase n=1 Tax=Streptomyces pacificus TaxID=2705029 RepID=A0A6A0AP30_9ACTN|nr:S8 family peptidase [Streptomyces pacificus]GFH34225.1 S8 family serine peptidase [Streptomyces pacificus]
MPTIFCAVLLGLALAAAPGPSAAIDPAGLAGRTHGQNQGETRSETAGRYIVTLKDAPTVSSAEAAVNTAVVRAASMGATVLHVYRHALHGYAASMTASTAAAVADGPGVRSVEPDRPVRIAAQSVPTGVDRAEADLSPTAAIDGKDTRVDADVAVIDTGIDADHPDLDVYVAGGKNCWLPNMPQEDGHGHGTHVAGIIGALDNGTGVVGVAPGVRLWPVQVFSPFGSGSTSSVICGIDHVTEHADEIDVVNMSLSGAGRDDGDCGRTDADAMHRAICNSVARGVTYAVAAGNDHADAAGFVPAAYDEVITVSALADLDGEPGGLGASTCRTDRDDTFADFSNYGRDVDLIAPGVCIRSTYPNGGYATLSGTSMATPHVAGGAALYRATHPGASPAEVKAALVKSGGMDWTWPSEDRDGIKEPLLQLRSF